MYIPYLSFSLPYDKNKFDPEGKAGKAKPGKPAVYLE